MSADQGASGDMANFPIIAADPVTWVFRALLLACLLFSGWSLFYPDRYRLWNLRLYERYRWLASPRPHQKMATASIRRLRFQSAVIVVYLAGLLLVSFKVLR